MNHIKTGETLNGQPIQLFYEEWGQGQPVVLIHGWPLSHEMWEYQITDLVEAGCRVIAYDRRGFGRSSKPWEGYDYDTLADDLATILNTLDLENAVIIGFSMGGGEIARYFSRHGNTHARKYPRIGKVVLLSAVTPLLLKTANNPEGVDKSVFENMIENLKNDRTDFLDTFLKQFFGVTLINKPVSTAFLEYYRTLCAVASPHATLECVTAFSRTDFSDDLRNINVPTLIIHGLADKVVPSEATAEKAALLVPENRLVQYDGAPHGLFYTDKDRLNKDLVSFIRETVPTPILD